ncbi:hypothetical protein [Endozoicomonas sp. 4G]|uniref:hypothetical protein n=1 Tax=Endozoicomonas sp. 4G TaxID=2872754 RepID=UPI002078B8E3|nr:hypothetical protein [Endozoicomonas sp. 4G]
MKEPQWVFKGKTIEQLIKELESFEDKSMEVRISMDDGLTHQPISIVGKKDSICLLINCESGQPLG